MSPSRVKITISDPWQLGEALGWRPMVGNVVRLEANAATNDALIELDTVVDQRAFPTRFVVATPRHIGESIEAIERGTVVTCSFTGISEEQAFSGYPLDLGSWRGGMAFTGTIARERSEPAT